MKAQDFRLVLIVPTLGPQSLTPLLRYLKGYFKCASGVPQLFNSNINSYIFRYYLNCNRGFPGGSAVKNLPAMWESWEMWI